MDLHLGGGAASVEERGGSPLATKHTKFTRSSKQSKALNDFKGPGIIISSSGMLTGGRILHHLKRLLPEDRNTVALAGYQAAGTRGRQMQDGARTIRIHGADVAVRAHLEDLSGFSGHADADEIMRWLGRPARPPKTIFLTHGEPAAATALAERIRKENGWTVRVPKLGEVAELAPG